MKVKDLIWKLQQIHNTEKQVYFGNVGISEEDRISGIIEEEFAVFIQKY